MQLLLLLFALADISVAPAANGCGGPHWRELRQALDDYCRVQAAPSERLGCRVARYAFDHCDAAPTVEADERGSIVGDIRDPRNGSYAWLLTFERRGRRFRLERFAYQFDDCDAMGTPPPPRGPLDLTKLRRPQSGEL